MGLFQYLFRTEIACKLYYYCQVEGARLKIENSIFNFQFSIYNLQLKLVWNVECGTYILNVSRSSRKRKSLPPVLLTE